MVVSVDSVLKDWSEQLYYRLPKKGKRCRTVAGTMMLSKAGATAAQLRSPRVLKATIRAAARKAPEVMVKISGAGKGMRQVRAHLDYISRNGQLTLENENGELICGKQAVRDLAFEWQHSLLGIPQEGRRRETFNIVLSMPAGTDREAVRLAAAEFGRQQFGNDRPYAFVAHEDEPHPHVHLCVKVLGRDGTRLNPRKADLQLWREQFAEALRGHGVDACATPRMARGTRQKTTSQAKHHRQPFADTVKAQKEPYPSERAQVARYAALARQLASIGGEGAWLAIDITKTVRRMSGMGELPQLRVPAATDKVPSKPRDRSAKDRER